MATMTIPAVKAAPTPMTVALKEAGMTAFVVFMLSFLMIGFESQATQGQPLGYVTRFGATAWGILLVPLGRIALVLDRYGQSMPSLIGGGLAFLYLAGGAVIALAFDVLVIPFNDYFGAAAGASGIPMPFADPIVDAIFGLGALYIVAMAIQTRRRAAHGELTLEERETKEERSSIRAKRLSLVLGPTLLVVAFVLPLTPLADRSLIGTLTLILTYVMLGWGLNIVVGLAGLLDLGYVAFYAVGAYTYAKLSLDLHLSFWASLPLAGMFAAFFGVMLGFPVLRLRGDYLAIVTLGFGEMVRIILINWQSFTGGPAGIGGIEKITFFGVPFERNPAEGTQSFHTLFGLEFSVMHRIVFLYYLILVLALVTNLFTIRLRRLPIGRAWEALREDETACRALGINPRNTKLTAFAMGAMFAGFAGSFFAVKQFFISPESFTFIESAVILAIVVLGGMGSQVGVALAAILLIGLPEVMRELSLYRMLAFGAVMILIMLWRPKGLLAHREPTILLHRGNGKPKKMGARA
ncbi:MAG TPA: high-affinity branched-chain amino acid ABC transporter permease LivM [Dongiaceae bacterium]|jgi:branched-chain amino acid transport system permease protein|nr:high-affinity branched-chain amino acid ABC transporter permease LivM [Dongiaceae bacterium]